MAVIKARYENGNLIPAKALPLNPGENVSLVVWRMSRDARWNLHRLAVPSEEEDVLSEMGLDDWIDGLDAEDRV